MSTDHGLSHYVGRRRARLSTPAQQELKNARLEAYKIISDAHQLAQRELHAHKTAMERERQQHKEAMDHAKAELRAVRISVSLQRRTLDNLKTSVSEADADLVELSMKKLEIIDDEKRAQGRERLRLITHEMYRHDRKAG